jgi:hypothetical protein
MQITVDMAVKEVDRGVQSLRDKQELLEAQVSKHTLEKVVYATQRRFRGSCIITAW